ncbi:16S rRNA (adenine(1518)-N(6)/adenine(1519)-N(6))-dimethyltransferase, partial [Streptomyces sp. T21Q-yed]|nr:16S rRNA (adenine(1518)-N(6)/adenine(1519)-N(6))-dimethyltransferase [Streptomyces sp. T21Q-yed]
VAAGVSPQARGEALTVEEFVRIAEHKADHNAEHEADPEKEDKEPGQQ